MKVSVNTVLTDIDGAPIKEGEHEFTLGRASCNALLATFPDEQGLAGEEKVKRFTLAAKVLKSADGLPIDLTLDEAKLAKDCIGKAYGPLIVGRAFPLLEGPSE